MLLTAAETLSFLKTAAQAGKDVFLYAEDGCTAAALAAAARAIGESLVLLPGPAFFEDRCVNAGRPFTPPRDPSPLFADVRLLSDDAFCEWLRRRGIRRLILPFAECAFLSEYGYRGSYRQIAELRATGFDLQVTAIFSAPGLNDQRLREILGSGETLLISTARLWRFPAVKADDDAERRSLAASVCRRQTMKKTVAFFPSRDAAAAFCAAAGGFSCLPFHGGLPEEVKRDALASFLRGDTQVLAATKHLLPSGIFFQADRVLYVGLPFGIAHAARCALLSPRMELTILYTEADRRLNEQLSLGFADALSAHRETLLRFRGEKQAALLQALEE